MEQEKHEEPTLAAQIRELSRGVKMLEEQGLNRKAIIVLLSDATKISRSRVKTVLDGLGNLEGQYCRPEQ